MPPPPPPKPPVVTGLCASVDPSGNTGAMVGAANRCKVSEVGTTMDGPVLELEDETTPAGLPSPPLAEEQPDSRRAARARHARTRMGRRSRPTLQKPSCVGLSRCGAGRFRQSIEVEAGIVVACPTQEVGWGPAGLHESDLHLQDEVRAWPVQQPRGDGRRRDVE